ncbi:MAG TPA: BamA/TamA family outer membrane protein [Kofleriaceae bacterium]|nr:BamA/TamA family outer membrane protein [Kofleriaceae bacterium]
MKRLCVVAILLTPAIAVAEPEPAPRPPTGRFVVGAGFSSDENFIAHAGIAQDDLFRTGQKLSLTADLSMLRQDFRIVHEVPDLLGSGLDLRSELFTRRRVHDTFARESAGGAITLGHQLDRTTRIYARYRLEHVAMDMNAGFLDQAALATPAGRLGDGVHAALGAGVEYSTLDEPFLPTRGSRLELFAERSDPALGSDYKVLTVSARAEHAQPLGPFTARLSAHGAYVRSLEAGGVPLSERLQYDGYAELPGYALGSFRSADLEAGGRAELELPIWRSAGISIAGFAEAGVRYNADPAWGPTGTTLARSVGASIIWRSPIGPLRFDWAVPLDGEERRPVFMFGMGSAF